MNNIEIASVTAKDFDELEKLYLTSLRNNDKGFIQDISFHGSIYEIAENLRANNGDFMVLKCKDKIIGMGGIKRCSNESVELCKLHVDPQYKGKGFGKQLTLELMNQAKRKGYDKMELHVTNTQTPAIGLYQNLGFQVYKQKLYTVPDAGKIKYFDTLFMNIKL